MTWDGSNLTVLPLTDDTGSVRFGDGTTDMDVRITLGASTTYWQFDVGLARLFSSGVDVTFHMGASASVSGSGTAMSASVTAAMRVYVDDGNAAIGSGVFARAGVFRHLLTYTGGNREQEAAGVVGQIVSVAGTNRHNMCGVMGSYEAQTSLTVDGQAWSTDPWIQAAVIGRVGVGTAITTVNANGILAGLAAMSNTVSFAAQNGLYAGLYVGSWSGAIDWECGIYIQAGAVSRAIQVGELSSTTPGSGVTMDATTTRAVEVHADDNNASRAVGTQARAIFGRTMIYADNACEDWGVHGLSKISGVAKTGNVSAGVVGAFESTGTCSIATGSGNSFVAGIMGRIGGGGTFTITSGNVVGVLSFYNTSTANAFTGTGTCAFMATASDIAGTGDWDYGIYLENVDVGIQFAHTLVPDSTRTNRAIGIGSRATEMDVTMAGAASQHLDPIQINLNIIGANPSGSSTVNGFYQLITHDTTDMSNLRIKNADWNVVVGMDVQDVYCYQGEIDFTTAAVTVGGEAAVLGLVMNAGSYTITGNLRGMIISMQGAGTYATAVGLEIRATCGTGLGTGLSEGIRIAGTPLPVVGIAMGNQTNDNEGPQNAFFFPSIGGADEGPCVASGTADGAIKIKIGADTKHIRFYTTA